MQNKRDISDIQKKRFKDSNIAETLQFNRTLT